jgi:hypothetical protein
MKLIENYTKSLEAIYNHVGFVEDWVIDPIDDCSDKVWNVDENSVYYADSEKEFIEENGNFYCDEIYKQRFYSKWIYEGEEITMIFCDPHVDGMKWFRIFDNSKRMTESKIREYKLKEIL